MRLTRLHVLAPLVGLALVAAACGSDDSSSDEAGPTTQAASATSGATSPTAGAPTGTPTSMDEWFALWNKERAAVVQKIKDGGYGMSADGKTVTGPGDFKIDLAKCPAGWSNTEGMTDTQVKIGHTTAQSGTLADYGNIARAMDVTWAYQNANGGFKDSTGKTRKLVMVTKDDGYDPARTIPAVDELIDSEKVFMVWTLGSPPTMKTYDKLNQRCIPQTYSLTGHPAWGDPVNHPWTTGLALSYTSEAILLGAFIEKRVDELAAIDGTITVGALVMNNDFGKAYDLGFKTYLDSSAIKDKVDYQPELIEPTAPTITDVMTTIASKDPEVFIAMTAGTSCTQAYTEAAQNGLKDSAKYLLTTQPCKGTSFVGKAKVGGDGSVSNGWWIAGGGNIDGNVSAEDDNPYFIWGRDLLAKAGYDYKASSSFLLGLNYSWPFWQALQIAGELDGGLNRTNLMLAVRSLDMTNPNLIPGIGFNMNGNKDSYPIEGSEIARYDSAQQTWVQQGDIVEMSGKSSNCAWDQATSSCKSP